MNQQHMHIFCIYGGGVNLKIESACLDFKKKSVKYFTLFCMFAFIFIFNHSSQAQQLSFTISTDTTYTLDQLLITNTSTGIPAWASYKWGFSGATSITFKDSVIIIDSMTFLVNNYQFTITPGLPGNSPWDSLKMVLIAVDTNGIPLNYPSAQHGLVLGAYLWTPSCSNVPDPCVNLVCNGSFETISTTQIEPNFLIYADSWYGLGSEIFNQNAYQWNYPTQFDVPSNMFGFQSAYAGIGYGGFHSRYSSNDPFYHQEVISTRLTGVLYAGQNYTVEYKASLAEQSTGATKLIAYIDDNASPMSYGGELDLAATNNPLNVVHNTAGYITDKTASWVPVSGTYSPSSNTFQPPVMVIGASDLTSSVSVAGGGYFGPLTYYYIDDVSVVPDLPVIEIFMEPSGPCFQYYVEAKDAQNVASYQWIVNGNPVPGATGVSAYLYSAGPVIACEVTNFHGCKQTFTVDVDYCVHDHSGGPASNIVVNNMNVANIKQLYTGGLSTWTTTEPINILGTLTIDEDFTFLNCPHIVMGRDARIVVKDNAILNTSLTINHCEIYSCNFECFMWDGIYATHPNSSVLIYETTISHAKNAVYSRYNPQLDIQGNFFTNNLVGIHITDHQRDCSPVPDGMPPPTLVDANVDISDNEFSGDLWNFQTFLSQYLPGFNGMEWGIRVDTVDLLTIGTGNTFEGLSCGIHINTGNVTIASNTFNSIQHHTSNPGVDEPFGHLVNAMFKEGAIVVTRIIDQGPQPVLDLCVPVFIRINENNVFINCRIGIYDFNHPLVVADNYFYDTKYNAIKGLQLPEATISNNSHSYSYLQNLHPNNLLNYEYYIGQPMTSAAGYPIDIVLNTITTYKNGVNLINATSTANPAVTQNYVKVRNNHIMLNDLNEDPVLQAIRIQACDRALVMMNILENIDPVFFPDNIGPMQDLKGIYVSATRDAKVFDNFLIKRFGQGVFNIGSNPGTQFWCNNFVEEFDGFYVDASSVVSNQLISTEQNRNSFYNITNMRVDNQSVLGFTWYYPSGYAQFNPNPYNNIFEASGYPPYLECAPIPDELLDDGTREALFGTVVRDEDTLYGPLQQEFAYMADEHLYNSLRNDTSLMYMGTVSDSLYMDYYNYYSTTNLAAIADIHEQIDQKDISLALASSTALAPTCPIEQNRKSVNEIYLQTWAKNLLPDSTQTDMLLMIAMLEPTISGNAVFSARVMLDIDPLNYNIAFKKWGETQETIDFPVKVYPNPASDYIMLEWMGEGLSTGGFLEVFDIQGKYINSMILEKDCPIQSFSVKDLRNGMYLMKISQTSGLQFNAKIIVNH